MLKINEEKLCNLELQICYFNIANEIVEKYKSDIVYDLNYIKDLKENECLIFCLRKMGTHCILDFTTINAVIDNFEIEKYLITENGYIYEVTLEEVLNKIKMEELK